MLSTSLFVIAWKLNEKNSGNNSGGYTENKDNTNIDDALVETVSINITTQAVQNGDNMDVATIIRSFGLLAVVAGTLVDFHRRRMGFVTDVDSEVWQIMFVAREEYKCWLVLIKNQKFPIAKRIDLW